MDQSMIKEQIIIPAQYHYLPVVRNFIARLAQKNRLTNSELNALTISIDEAVTNIIKHGYGGMLAGSITLNVNVRKDRLLVELIDQGKSFDPNQVSDPNIAHYVQVRKKGGLGIFIIRKFMDDIQYVTSGQENILRLIKLRNIAAYSPIVPLFSFFKRLKEKFQLLIGKTPGIDLSESSTFSD